MRPRMYHGGRLALRTCWGALAGDAGAGFPAGSRSGRPGSRGC